MGCTASTATNQVVDIGRREGARSGTPVSLTDWSPDADKASSSSGVADSITIVHFNDVYNIEERHKEPVGGAARFKSQIDSLRHLEPLILFSGDALNPSNSQFQCVVFIHLAKFFSLVKEFCICVFQLPVLSLGTEYKSSLVWI